MKGPPHTLFTTEERRTRRFAEAEAFSGRFGVLRVSYTTKPQILRRLERIFRLMENVLRVFVSWWRIWGQALPRRCEDAKNRQVFGCGSAALCK